MSSFICEKCGKAIIDTPYKGYITECKHYPFLKKIKNKKLDKIKNIIYNTYEGDK